MIYSVRSLGLEVSIIFMFVAFRIGSETDLFGGVIFLLRVYRTQFFLSQVQIRAMILNVDDP